VTPNGRPTMKRLVALATAAAALTAAAPLAAQLSLEVRGGAAVGNASQSLSGLDMAPRPAFGAGFSLPVRGPATAYAAYTRSAFGCEEGFCIDRDVTFVSHGVSAGVRLEHGQLPYLQAGLLYHALDTRARTGGDSGEAGIGYELGVGYAVPLTPRIAVTPALTYRRHDAVSGGVDGYAALVTGEIGVRFRLR
jgi:opacity protein-like surface antigen